MSPISSISTPARPGPARPGRHPAMASVPARAQPAHVRQQHRPVNRAAFPLARAAAAAAAAAVAAAYSLVCGPRLRCLAGPAHVGAESGPRIRPRRVLPPAAPPPAGDAAVASFAASTGYPRDRCPCIASWVRTSCGFNSLSPRRSRDEREPGRAGRRCLPDARRLASRLGSPEAARLPASVPHGPRAAKTHLMCQSSRVSDHVSLITCL